MWVCVCVCEPVNRETGECDKRKTKWIAKTIIEAQTETKTETDTETRNEQEKQKHLP